MKDDVALISEVLTEIPNKYMAVIVASKRAKAINDGARPLLKTGATKTTTIALEEISKGLITPKQEGQAIEAAEEEGNELLPPPDDRRSDG